SKLSFSEEELDTFSHQIGDILTYVELLNELDTEGVPQTARVIPSHNILREDVVQNTLSIEDALSNAPAKENNMFKVPKI
ncbi:MAG: Asp-tRNA(Asn)/Glu-tRNA(Gln) amidotransferase subunit GatC, partial [Candidatus Sericytochromatia bacterium]